MMESLIEQIYNGEYYPAEDLLPTSEAYREAKRSVRCGSRLFASRAT